MLNAITLFSEDGFVSDCSLAKFAPAMTEMVSMNMASMNEMPIIKPTASSERYCICVRDMLENRNYIRENMGRGLEEMDCEPHLLEDQRSSDGKANGQDSNPDNCKAKCFTRSFGSRGNGGDHERQDERLSSRKFSHNSSFRVIPTMVQKVADKEIYYHQNYFWEEKPTWIAIQEYLRKKSPHDRTSRRRCDTSLPTIHPKGTSGTYNPSLSTQNTHCMYLP